MTCSQAGVPKTLEPFPTSLGAGGSHRGHSGVTTAGGGWQADCLPSGSFGSLSKSLGQIHVYNGENCIKPLLEPGPASVRPVRERASWP